MSQQRQSYSHRETSAASASSADENVRFPQDVVVDIGRQPCASTDSDGDVLNDVDVEFESASFFHSPFGVFLHECDHELCSGQSGQSVATVELLRQRNTMGEVPLHCAARSGRVDVVSTWLQRWPQGATSVSCNGATPLHVAAELGYTHVVEVLLNLSAFPETNHPSCEERAAFVATPLFLASQNGHVEVVRLLAARAPGLMNGIEGNGRTSISIATHFQHTDVVQALVAYRQYNSSSSGRLDDEDDATSDFTEFIQAAFDPEETLRGSHRSMRPAPSVCQNITVTACDDAPGAIDPTLHHVSAILLASASGDTDTVRRLLMEQPDSARDVTTKNETPLYLAAEEGHLDAVQLLLAVWPQAMDVKTASGMSPILAASENGHTDVVKLLVQVKPDSCTDRNRDGWTPIYLAALHGHAEVVECLASLSVGQQRNRFSFEALQLVPRCSTQLRFGMEFSLFDVACRCQHLKVLQVLADMDPEGLFTADHRGVSPIHHASGATLRFIVDKYEKGSRKPQPLPADGTLPLHIAVQYDRMEDVEFLMQTWPSDATARLRDGRTVFHVAAQWGRLRMLQYVLARVLRIEVPSPPAPPLLQADQQGLLPIHYAATVDRPTYEWLRRQHPETQWVKDAYGFSAHFAAQLMLGAMAAEDEENRDSDLHDYHVEGNDAPPGQVSDLSVSVPGFSDPIDGPQGLQDEELASGRFSNGSIGTPVSAATLMSSEEGDAVSGLRTPAYRFTSTKDSGSYAGSSVCSYRGRCSDVMMSRPVDAVFQPAAATTTSRYVDKNSATALNDPSSSVAVEEFPPQSTTPPDQGDGPTATTVPLTGPDQLVAHCRALQADLLAAFSRATRFGSLFDAIKTFDHPQVKERCSQWFPSPRDQPSFNGSTQATRNQGNGDPFSLDVGAGTSPMMVACAFGNLQAVKILSAHVYAPVTDTTDAKHRTALWYAVAFGHLPIFSFLTSRFPKELDLNATEFEKLSIFSIMVWRRWEDTAQLILERGGAIIGCTGLACAVDGGLDEVVMHILDWHITHPLSQVIININGRDPFGWAPLHYAIGRGNLRLTELLLNRGADPTIRTASGKTTLMVATLCEKMDVLKYLLSQPYPDKRADVNAVDPDGKSIMEWAMERKFFNIVRLLVQYVDINDPRAFPLMWAVKARSLECLRLILPHPRLNILAVDPTTGYTALHEAARLGWAEGVKEIVESAALFTDSMTDDNNDNDDDDDDDHGGIDVKRTRIADIERNLFRGRDDQTPLLAAVSVNSVASLRVMLSRVPPSVDPTMQRRIGSVLLQSVRTCSRDVLDVFLDASDVFMADEPTAAPTSPVDDMSNDRSLRQSSFLTQADGDGLTALHIAARYGNLPVVQRLCDVFPDGMLQKDALGRIPLHLAAEGNRAEVIAFMMKVKGDCAAMTDLSGRLPVEYASPEVKSSFEVASNIDPPPSWEAEHDVDRSGGPTLSEAGGSWLRSDSAPGPPHDGT